MEQQPAPAQASSNPAENQQHKPRLYYIKIEHRHTHQGCVKTAQRIITTHDTRIMPKYFKDRGWQFARASKKSA